MDIDKLIEEGWQYIDPPVVFTEEMWDNFCAMFGELSVDYHILAMSVIKEPDGVFYRGQLLVSPNGIKNAREKAKWFQHDEDNP